MTDINTATLTIVQIGRGVSVRVTTNDDDTLPARLAEVARAAVDDMLARIGERAGESEE